MSLLGDTIRDAHRPLPGRGGEVLRRIPLEEYAESGPEEEYASSGLQTVFRFQKEGPSPPMTAPREASFRSGSRGTDLPAGDPLSVESKVERPNLSASKVDGNEDFFSVTGENRGNELATGQMNHGSPGWTTAAEMSSETSTHQSVVGSEPNESDSAHQQQKSREQQGSVEFVSEQEETYQSRIPGQGAPSESFFTAPIPPLRSVTPGPTSAERPHLPGQISWPAEAVPGQAVENPPWGQGENDPDREPLASSASRPHTTGAAVLQWPAGYAEAPSEALFTPSASVPPEAAQLVIGRIDVVVVSTAEQKRTQSIPTRQSDSGFVSRNYLKRL
nr:hypothetical protein [uncultured Desulfobulbus sp.]